MVKTKPHFSEEKSYWAQGINLVIGLDEVGRGSFAGPIVGAGVIYKPGFQADYLNKVNDSKLLSAKLREELSEKIKENSVWFIEEVDVDFINKFGIGKANFEVFSRIIQKFFQKIGNEKHFILADGFDLKIPNQRGIIKGDSISLSIASASIIAKVYRDNLMTKAHNLFPEYAFDENKGYGTLKHREAINSLGLCRLHRTSFNIA